jgi:DNA-binding NarL/FixJ family response regulator
MKIIIADSGVLFRAGLNAILSQYPEFTICAEASSSAQLKEMVHSFKPDVVFIDYASAGFDIDVIPFCLRICKGVRFIALTGDQPGLIIAQAMRAGVTSYIRKDCDIPEILASARETKSGERYFCGKVLDTLRRESMDVREFENLPNDCGAVAISPRELEIITLIAEGYTNSEIADKLYLSTHTVNTHRKNILSKLGVNNTAAVVMYAVKTGLVSPNKFLFGPLLPS